MKRRLEEGIILILISAASLSIYSFFVKLGLKEVSVLSITFLRFFLPLLLGLPFFWWNGTLKELWPLNNIKLQFLRSLSVVATQFFMIYYLTQATLVDANMLWCTGPIFIPIISRLFYGHQIHKMTWISIGISFLGVILVLKPDQGIFDPFSIFGLLSGIGMAISQLLYGINIEKGRVGENLFYLSFFCSLLTLIPFLIWEEISFDLKPDMLTIVAITAFSVASLINQLFRGLAYTRASPVLLTPFLYFSVLLSGILDWTFYHKAPDIWAYIGFLLVLLGTGLKWLHIRRI
jgi:drug/metabolite transporter (DMT)-like permease